MRDTYQEITNRILDLLNTGVVPWRKPWSASGYAPSSLASGKAYRGINTFLLNATPYVSPYWVTYKQAQERGGHVRKGEKGWPLVFWKIVTKNNDEGEAAALYPFLKTWTVFNVEQTEGLSYTQVEKPTFDTIEAAEAIIAGMPNAPKLSHDGGAEAYYRPSSDSVHLPRRESFRSPESYFNVAFHELSHATGHLSRLNRPGVGLCGATFGTKGYAREELVAEMAAAMLGGECGIVPSTIDNSAAYVANWLGALAHDTKLVIVAAGAAQKAADYIMGRVDAETETADAA